jgi:hypothetical protein
VALTPEQEKRKKQIEERKKFFDEFGIPVDRNPFDVVDLFNIFTGPTKVAAKAGVEIEEAIGEALAPDIPVPPVPEVAEVPTEDDPEVLAARERQRQAELRRRGRRAAILTGGQGVTDPLGVVNRPQARSATLLGQ